MSLADSLRRLVINLRCKMCVRPFSVETARSSLGAHKAEHSGEVRVRKVLFLPVDGKVNLLFVPEDPLTHVFYKAPVICPQAGPEVGRS